MNQFMRVLSSNLPSPLVVFTTPAWSWHEWCSASCSIDPQYSCSLPTCDRDMNNIMRVVTPKHSTPAICSLSLHGHGVSIIMAGGFFTHVGVFTEL